MLVPLNPPPGLYRNGTFYQASGRWNNANLVRFHEGVIRPLGGWVQKSYGTPSINIQLLGKARGCHQWNAPARTFAIGTHTKLYVAQNGTQPIDITPVGLPAGSADAVANEGYGSLAYGTQAYGVPRVGSAELVEPSIWSMDNFGTLLIACRNDEGKLYLYSNNGMPATEIIATAGTAPINNDGVIVTEERHVMVWGANGNQRLIQWSNQESYLNWQITATTTAGDFELQSSGKILSIQRTKSELLILTSADIFVGTYLGAPLVYGFQRASDGAGLIAQKAVVSTEAFSAWMSRSGFYVYDGNVRPIPCEVSDYVFSDFNYAQADKVWATTRKAYNEVTWYYCSGGSPEIDRYVTWNHLENHWCTGSLSRTTGFDAGVFSLPLMVGADGKVYDHEKGWSYSGEMPFLESGPMELNGGDRVCMARFLYPDEKTQGDVVARFTTKFYPNAQTYDFGPYSLSNPTPVRFTGRQMAMRVDGTGNADWRLGVSRLDIAEAGLR